MWWCRLLNMSHLFQFLHVNSKNTLSLMWWCRLLNMSHLFQFLHVNSKNTLSLMWWCRLLNMSHLFQFLHVNSKNTLSLMWWCRLLNMSHLFRFLHVNSKNTLSLVVDLPKNLAPILIELVQAALPQTVSLNVRSHAEADKIERYVPDLELKQLKTELDSAGGPTKKNSRFLPIVSHFVT